MNEQKIEKAARALLGMELGVHRRPKKPTKKDLQRKFRMKLGRKGDPSIEEVE